MLQLHRIKPKILSGHNWLVASVRKSPSPINWIVHSLAFSTLSLANVFIGSGTVQHFPLVEYVVFDVAAATMN